MSLFRRIPFVIRWILQFTFLLLLLMFLYRWFFFHTYSQPGRPFSGTAFILGLRYDARVVAVVGIVMLLVCAVPSFNPFKNGAAKRGWGISLGLLSLIFSVVYIADYYHYDYLQQRLSASMINFLPDAGISFNMVRQTYPVGPIVISLVIVLSFFAWFNVWVLGRMMASHKRSPMKKSTPFFIGAAVLMGVLIFGRIGQYPLRWSDAFTLGDDFKGNAALNPFQSFFSSLQFRNSSYDLKKVKGFYPLMSSYLGVQHPDAEKLDFERNYQYADTTAAKPNIVVVICESFSANKSSMYGSKLNSTPFFNSLCNEGVFFSRCFTPAFGTARGVWATLTGIPDVEFPKTASRNPSAVNQHLIINDFKPYEKYYFLGGSTTWANIRGVLTNNIDGLHIFEEDSYEASTVDVWGISDRELFMAANAQMSKARKPFFAIIQTADNHRPYTIPKNDLPEFKVLNYPSDTLRKYGFTGNDQFNAFRYSDFCFQKFFEKAATQAYFKNTIFVFVGDHGLRGSAGDLFPKSYSAQGFTAEHVPLLFYSPALLKPAKISDVCSQLDIMPSVASLAKQSFRNTTMGRNLFDTAIARIPYAFIADPDTRFIGLLSNQFYYGRNLSTGAKEFVSIVNDAPVTGDSKTDSIKSQMATFTEAWYQTARYLLTNNKKKN
jgi:phosphoglycerol transferase MdoB-like AlkP superfamily enzyme